MGGVCSGGVRREDAVYTSNLSGFSGKLKSAKSFSHNNKHEKDPISFPDVDVCRKDRQMYDSCELGLCSSVDFKPSTPARTAVGKVPQVGTLLGRAGIVGLERAVEVIDTLGSSMSSLTPNSGFVSGMSSKGNKICILAFEVANTIVKGANLLQSLSPENIRFLKEEVLPSDGVQKLVSTDTEELLRIAAADKRDEFNIFMKEVIRFGDKCKDPQWHNLGRYFQKLDSDVAINRQYKEEAQTTVRELTVLAHHTAELYHELHALDRFEQDYQRKLEEVESLHLPRRGESLLILHSELKNQRKLVRSLRKKSLWSKSLEEVMEKLVDVVTFIHQEISEAFKTDGTTSVIKDPNRNTQRLGVAGLALHYANIINQIDNIVSRPSSLPPNMRDTLYHGLPPGVKAALRSRLQLRYFKEELTVAQIKAEMEKNLQWLVPVASNTTKAHQGFGWVGEWANTGNEFNKKTSGQNSLLRLETLYHADKEKTEAYILELVTWLHHLISQVRQRDFGFKPMVPVRSPTRKAMVFPSGEQKEEPRVISNIKADRILLLSQVDRDMLDVLSSRRLNPGISKSQEFLTTKKKAPNRLGMSKSSGSSPTREFCASECLEHKKIDVLDVIDGLDTTF